MEEEDKFKPILENEKVRILRINIKPGEKTKMHAHPYQHVVCCLSDQKLKFTTSEGEKKVDISFGQVLYFQPTTHVVENIGETEANSIVIELKK